ncbi:MAG: hypothetical protein LQ346_006018 [Caloplaca aetnensis]|nr:MAG: hypothetical protein LQ346_006018 [Caloplaca aetnensis]
MPVILQASRSSPPRLMVPPGMTRHRQTPRDTARHREYTFPLLYDLWLRASLSYLTKQSMQIRAWCGNNTTLSALRPSIESKDRQERIHSEEISSCSFNPDPDFPQISTAVLLGLCALSVTLRFYIRVRLQRDFSIDDAFLIVAFGCLICAMVVLYTATLNNLYLVHDLSTALPFAMSMGFPIEDMPADSAFLQPVYEYLKWITVNQTLAGCSVFAVKFSFLFLFRKLIDRLPRLITYWWFALAFNIAAFGYCFSTNFLNCPYYNDRASLYKCATPSGVARLMRHGIAQTAVDIIGDLLILYIPINLIWKIQIRWTQKVPLVLSLCLTAVIILVTITRIAGIKRAGAIDSVWESYFLIVGAEVGIILASVSTYRTLFVSHRKATFDKVGKRARDQQSPSSPVKGLFKRVFLSSPWRSKVKEGQSTPDEEKGQHHDSFDTEGLPEIPRAHMTGVRTFINARGKGTDGSNVMESRMTQDDDDDEWPLRREKHTPEDNAITK